MSDHYYSKDALNSVGKLIELKKGTRSRGINRRDGSCNPLKSFTLSTRANYLK